VACFYTRVCSLRGTNATNVIQVNISLVPRIVKVIMSSLESHCLSIRLSFCLSAWKNSVSIWRIFMKFGIWSLRKFANKIQVPLNSENDSRYFTRRSMRIYDRASLNFFRMTKVSEKKLYRKSKHILRSMTFFFLQKSFHLWDNVQKYGTARQATVGNTIRCMRFACWITKATDTHSEYVILLFQGKKYYAKGAQCFFESILSVFLVH
jgi:hypothetical protein